MGRKNSNARKAIMSWGYTNSKPRNLIQRLERGAGK